MPKGFSNINLPNKLTLLRVALVPVFVACLMINTMGTQIAALAIFIIASLTDLVDGKIARSRNLITTFGKFMDPIADKLLVTSAMIGLCAMGKMHWLIPMVSIAREFVISGIRMVASTKNIVIAAGMLGKAKTETQMFGIAFCIAALGIPCFSWLEIPSLVLLWASVILSVWSCAVYIKNAKGVFDDGM